MNAKAFLQWIIIVLVSIAVIWKPWLAPLIHKVLETGAKKLLKGGRIQWALRVRQWANRFHY